MNMKVSTNRKFRRTFVNILSIFVILAMVFPVTGSVSAQEPALPVGWHDGVEGVVNAGSCGAFGWTVDPDDPNRDLQVRILADGNSIATTTADLFRQDLDACTEGTCGFGVNLWGLITAGEEHQITAQAYDEETSTWVDLSGTPKAVTCWGYPEGFHDGNDGTVDANSCTASGWVADPDDRDRDLQVQVLVDGNVVAETTANLLREDVTACTAGTCGYSVGLWDLISPDVEHQITVQAFDVETNTWMNLEATPKLLTCQTPPPPNPFLVAAITQNWMWAYNFHPETMVTISVYETKNSPDPVLVLSRQSDEFGNVEIEGWEHNWDLETGNYMVATDEMISDDLMMDYITLDVFDPDNDIISGKTSSERKVSIGVGGAGGEQWIDVFADSTGKWSGDFSTVGFDITPDMWASGNVYDEDGDITAAHNSGPALGPRFVVFPEWEWFDGLDWPDGANVTIAVEGKPECETAKESWGGFFNGNFGVGCNIEVGDNVTFTSGTITRTHTVQNLAITKVNQEDDTIKGIANAGADVHVWPHATGQEQMVIANPKGKWDVDFSGIFDLAPGEGGRSEIRDAFGNATAVDWYISNPRIVASITEDWFYVQEFRPNTTLNVTVYMTRDGKPIWQGTATTDGSGFVWVDAEGRWNLEPGNYLIVKDGQNTKALIIEGFTFEVFNLANGQLIGTTPDPYRHVWAGIGWENDTWTMDVTSDVNGNWQADFAKPVSDDYWWVAAQIFDSDGDASELRPSVVINWTPVIANQPDWVSSGINVSAGQSITIEAFGLMNPCSDTYPNGDEICIFYTPVGADWLVPYENMFGIFPGPGLRFMGLLGRIGDGEPFYVGTGGTFTAGQTGTLWFTPNDNLRTDNQGAYSVLVWLEP